MLEKDFKAIINDVKLKIQETEFKMVSAINKETLELFLYLGKVINDNKEYGSKFVENLSTELKLLYPNSTGFSRSNLFYMQRIYKECLENSKVQPLVGLLPWTLTNIIFDKIKDTEVRVWYMTQAVENGWSKAVLIYQLDTDLYSRQVTADKMNNFDQRLISPQSELADELMKDPYKFALPLFNKKIKETELENSLVSRIKDTLLELGNGFSFITNQYRIVVDGDEYFIDMLFYNTILHCYIVVELKTVPFEPEFAGKLNFYISAVDKQVRKTGDNQTIGLLLCQDKKKIKVEYALEGSNRPIGIASYEILPKEIAQALPSEEDINMHVNMDNDIEEGDAND